MHPFLLLLAVISLLGVAQACFLAKRSLSRGLSVLASAVFYQDNHEPSFSSKSSINSSSTTTRFPSVKAPRRHPPTRLSPIKSRQELFSARGPAPLPESADSDDPPNGAKGSKDEATSAELASKIKSLIKSRKPSADVLAIFNFLQKHGLDKLERFELGDLLRALSSDKVYELQAVEVFNEFKKSKPFSHYLQLSYQNACASKSTTLVAALLPHMSLSRIVECLGYPGRSYKISYTMRDLILKSVKEEELPDALHIAASRNNNELFDHLLRAAKDKGNVLKSVIGVKDHYLQKLNMVIFAAESNSMDKVARIHSMS